jgi:hypothetical protein
MAALAKQKTPLTLSPVAADINTNFDAVRIFDHFIESIKYKQCSRHCSM